MSTIYVVMGTVGEFSDRREWAVAAYESEELAQRHVELASQRGREIEAARIPGSARDKMTGPERGAAWNVYVDTWKTNQFDANFRCDYHPATYFLYEEVPLRTSLPTPAVASTPQP